MMSWQERCFHSLQRRMIVYNACCEDPALDCEALSLKSDDRALVITSGGCNALAYLLAGAGRVEAVDVNPCQNALLEFKAAAIRALDLEDVWELFGEGRCPRVRALYGDAIRRLLSTAARQFWDRRLHLFHGSLLRPSFHHHGGWGCMMRLIQASWQVRGLRRAVEQLFETSTLSEQWEHYAVHLRPYLWQRWFCWLASRSFSYALLGIPPRQRRFILNYPGGLFRYGQALLDDLVAHIPLATNYFMHANAFGCYRKNCCPDYLVPEGFRALKNGLLERLSVHTASVTSYLDRCGEGITKFVLLDHMDWLSPAALVEEWEVILAKAAPGAVILFRSALIEVNYLDDLIVTHRGRQRRLGELLVYDRELAAALHRRDRVHLYGSFSICRLSEGP
jgi:S-adenosylmethionine-diacylglycerol 3-amino-3-carboxypropyl transferase